MRNLNYSCCSPDEMAYITSQRPASTLKGVGTVSLLHQTTGFLSFAFLSPLASTSSCITRSSDLIIQDFISLSRYFKPWQPFSGPLAPILGRKASINH